MIKSFNFYAKFKESTIPWNPMQLNFRFVSICIKSLLLLFLFNFSESVFSQDLKINFKHYSINEGLSQNTVYCLLQDKYGYIWIGTEDGLNRFDGYEFTTYKHENKNKNSISHNQVNTLLEDTDGKIWVGTSGGLNVFDRKFETFTKIKITDGNYKGNEFITSIVKGKNNILWIGSSDGLKSYDLKTQKTSLYKAYDSLDNVNNRVSAILEDKNGKLWVSIGKNLCLFDPIKRKFISLPSTLDNSLALKNSHIRVLKQDKKQRIWMGTENSGIFIYDEKNSSLINLLNKENDGNSLPINTVREIFFSENNEVWIGSRNGLSIYNEQTNTYRNYFNNRYNPNSLSHNSVRTIIRDRAGNIWLGTFSGGLNLITPESSTFSYIREEIGNIPGLSYNLASCIIKADANAIWIGTEGVGLNYVDPVKSIFRKYKISPVSSDVSSNTVKSLLKDSKDKNSLWVGSLKGLSLFNISNGTANEIQLPEDKTVSCLAQTNEGLWIGTNGGGLMLRDPSGKFTIFKHNPNNLNSISGNNILKIIKDKLNNLWIGTEHGLNYYDKKQFKQFFYNPDNKYSISNNSILSLLIDSKNRLWVGANGGGLNYYHQKSGKFYSIDKQLGLANDVIKAIEEDKEGNLWVSTNKGLSKISLKKQVLPFTESSISISNYFSEDGLLSNQFLTGSSYKNDNGELFFGGINGVTYFNPSKIKLNTFKPPVVFTDFQIRNRSVSYDTEDSPLKQAINETEELTLRYDQTFVTFKFAALNYSNPNKNQYAYKLEGFPNDDEWHYVNNVRAATYTNLEAGNYVLKIKAANNDGVWNDSNKVLKIKVLPPWWKSWWAFLCYAMFIGVLLYLYYSYSIKNAKLKNDFVFEQMSHEKDQELAQRKLSFFTNISHEIKTPVTLIVAPVEKLLEMSEVNNTVRSQLLLIKRNGDRLLRLINQLLDFRKFENGNMALEATEGDMIRFVQEVLTAFEAYAQHLKINLKIECDKTSIKAWFDRDKFEKILFNLLSNALKFTKEGGEIIVRIATVKSDLSAEGFVVIEVEDNGYGISEENIDRIFDAFNHFNEGKINRNGSGIGLTFTKALVELHRGTIAVKSVQEKDGQQGFTCFTIKMPLGKGHLNENELLPDYKNSEDIEVYYEQDFPMPPSALSNQRIEKVLDAHGGEAPVMLVVEDNSSIMDFIVSHFEDKFTIYKAQNGKEGINKAIEVIPDIIISDVMMPEVSGTQLCNTLKNDSRTSHIPIILLTARTPLIYKIEGLENGADDYITKPFSIKIVETRVWNLLEQRQKLRERYSKEITLQPTNLSITTPDEIFLEKVMKFIEENLTEPSLNVEELAKQVFMSKITLYRKIKALTNQTTIEFIRSVRIKRAAQILQKQTFTSAEVCYMVGFTDVDYFRKCFKEMYGKTPKEFTNEKV